MLLNWTPLYRRVHNPFFCVCVIKYSSTHNADNVCTRLSNCIAVHRNPVTGLLLGIPRIRLLPLWHNYGGHCAKTAKGWALY